MIDMIMNFFAVVGVLTSIALLYVMWENFK